MLCCKEYLCFGVLIATVASAPGAVSAEAAASASYVLEATVMDAAGGVNSSFGYHALTTTAQAGTVGVGGALSYTAGYGFIAGAARLLEEDEGEGEGGIEGEYEGESPEEGEPVEGETEGEPAEGEGPSEGEQAEGESEGEPAEGEVHQEGEAPAEGEGEGEGEEVGCGCGCCRESGKRLSLPEMMDKTLGDWLLVGLSILGLMICQRSGQGVMWPGRRP